MKSVYLGIGLVWLGSVLSLARSETSVRLLNGNRLSAEFLRLEKGRGIFKTDWSRERVSIPARYIGKIDFPPSDPRLSLQTEIRLFNGDYFRGKVLAADETHFLLKTAWADLLRIKRSHVRSLDFTDLGKETVYLGPGSLESWKIESSEPGPYAVVSGGTDGILFHGKAGIRKKLPPVGTPFELAWTLGFGDPNSLVEVGISDISSQDGAPLLHLFSFSSGTIRYSVLEGGARRVGSWRIEMADRQWMTGKSPYKFRLTVDPEQNQLTLSVNDLRVKAWRDEHISFTDSSILAPRVHLNVDRLLDPPLTFRTLALSKLASPPARPAPPSNPEALSDATVCRVYLRNGDVFEAELLSADDSGLQLRWNPATDPVLLPRTRISRIEFPEAGHEEPRRHARDVRILAHGARDRLTLRLLGSEQGRLTFTHEAMEEQQLLPVTHLDRIRFNPYLRIRHDTPNFPEWTVLSEIQ